MHACILVQGIRSIEGLGHETTTRRLADPPFFHSWRFKLEVRLPQVHKGRVANARCLSTVEAASRASFLHGTAPKVLFSHAIFGPTLATGMAYQY